MPVMGKSLRPSPLEMKGSLQFTDNEGAKMKFFTPLLACLLLAPALASAGAIYGTVRTAGPVTKVTLTIACPSFSNPRETVGPMQVDARGSFRARVRTNGRCEMRAQSGQLMGSPFPVFSSSKSLRFDFRVDARMNRVP